MFNVNNKLFENIISLFSIKGLEYLLAFITFPYLTRVLEVEKFGAIVFAQGIIQYFVLFTDYGFNLLAPREIAKNDETKKRGKVFAAIFYGKLLLLVVSMVIFLFVFYSLCLFKNNAVDLYLYGVWFVMVIGNVIFPIWFFQGIQEMRYISFANILARTASVICIFFFVKTPSDYLLAAFFQAVVPCIAGLYSWIIIYRKYREVIRRPVWNDVQQQLISGWTIFTSTIAINMYTASNVIFLGILTNNTVVGYFSGAKKIVDNINALFAPISQAVYPHICKLAETSHEKALAFIRKVLFILGGSSFILSLVLFIFAEEVVWLLLGNGYDQSILMLRIMSFLPFIISLSNIFGVQTMLTFGMQSIFSKILVTAAILNIIAVLPFIYFYQAIGASSVILFVESYVTLTMWYIIKKNDLDLFKV